MLYIAIQDNEQLIGLLSQSMTEGGMSDNMLKALAEKAQAFQGG